MLPGVAPRCVIQGLNDSDHVSASARARWARQIAKPDHEGPPPLDATRCIHRDYLQSAVVEFTWDDTGSFAAMDGSVWSCRAGLGSTLIHPTFFSRRDHEGPGHNECHGLRESLAEPG